MSSATVPVSVVVLTLNEEVNIAACLASCSWCDDVHVLDSGSTDRTVEIARASGAQTSVHRFDAFGAQRNWAIDHLPTRHEWIFHLDADERFTPELVEELARIVAADPIEAGFFVSEKLMFMNRWLKSAGYPKYQMRFFHKARMRFRDYGHGQRELTDGAVGTLNQPYVHLAFNKGLDDWLAKHNRYSLLEARQVIEGSREEWLLLSLVARDRVRRRRAWKELAYHVPLRPLARWLDVMIVRGGIFEGRAGWTYAHLLAVYEQMITLKLRMLRHSRSTP
jgi:glycosyltransferase involved in cell wall biosynthesis